MTVLLVDDSHVFASALRRLLQSRGVHSLVVATTRQAAIEHLTKEVRAVLVDFDLGSGDPGGGQLLLEHLDRTKNPAFRILQTGHETTTIRAAAARHRAIWLLKGEPIETLLDFLAMAGVHRRNASGVHATPSVRNEQKQTGHAQRDRQGRWHSRGQQMFARIIDDLTAARVAEVLNVTCAMVSALSVGARQPSLRLAAAIEHHFGIGASAWAAAPATENINSELIRFNS